jgi:hypothetical protein
METASLPVLSVLLVTPRPYSELREVVRQLRKQGPVDGIELVIVAPSLARLGIDEGELRDFWGVLTVEYGPLDSLGRAFGAAVRAASAPVVAFAEDHAYPEQGWAEALIQAHKERYGAVGAAITNANPDSALSWGNLLVSYGPWVPPVQAGVVDDLPNVNVSFNRAALLELGDDLDPLLEKGGDLFLELRARGYELYLEPAARLRHVNFSRLSSTARYRVNMSRLLAAARAEREGWSRTRRLLYLVGGPLIPGVRLLRMVGDLRRRGHHLHPRLVSGMVVGLLFDAAGQMLAFAAGPGRSLDRLHQIEFQGRQPDGLPRPA